MLRYYFAFILAVAVAASMVSSPDPAAAPAEKDERPIAIVTEPPPAAELRQLHGAGVILDRQPDGHFYADAEINGTSIRMLVDTGASGIALTRNDARKAGIGISIGMPEIIGQGAGGAVKGEYVMLDRISLGSEAATGVPAVVLDGGGQSLLGQSFLQQFASVEIRDDRMLLR